MAKYVCNICDWTYDEENGLESQGIQPNTKWEDVKEDFVCPLCNVKKDEFTKVND